MTIGWYFLLDSLADVAAIAAFVLFGTIGLSRVSGFETVNAAGNGACERQPSKEDYASA